VSRCSSPKPIELLEPYWSELDIVTIVGTAMGIKGASMDATVPGKICKRPQNCRAAAIEHDD